MYIFGFHHPDYDKDCHHIIEDGAPVLQDGHGSGSPERLHGQIGVAGELRVSERGYASAGVFSSNTAAGRKARAINTLRRLRLNARAKSIRGNIIELLWKKNDTTIRARARIFFCFQQKHYQTEHGQIDGNLLTSLERVPEVPHAEEEDNSRVEYPCLGEDRVYIGM